MIIIYVERLHTQHLYYINLYRIDVELFVSYRSNKDRQRDSRGSSSSLSIRSKSTRTLSQRRHTLSSAHYDANSQSGLLAAGYIVSLCDDDDVLLDGRVRVEYIFTANISLSLSLLKKFIFDDIG